jgi:hypothetical protein
LAAGRSWVAGRPLAAGRSWAAGHSKAQEATQTLVVSKKTPESQRLRHCGLCGGAIRISRILSLAIVRCTRKIRADV